MYKASNTVYSTPMNNNITINTRPRRPRTLQSAPRALETFKYAPRRTLGVQNAIWGAIGFILLLVVTSVASIWTMRAQMTPPVAATCTEFVGSTHNMEYENGVWTSQGHVIGYGQFEDSKIMSTPSCAGLR